jgi:hypothetical protein
LNAICKRGKSDEAARVAMMRSDMIANDEPLHCGYDSGKERAAYAAFSISAIPQQ